MHEEKSTPQELMMNSKIQTPQFDKNYSSKEFHEIIKILVENQKHIAVAVSEIAETLTHAKFIHNTVSESRKTENAIRQLKNIARRLHKSINNIFNINESKK